MPNALEPQTNKLRNWPKGTQPNNVDSADLSSVAINYTNPDSPDPMHGLHLIV